MMKGFCANQENPAHVNALAPNFIVIGWGAWLLNPAIDYGTTQIVVALFDADPTFAKSAANIAAVVAKWGNRLTWLTLREPDLNLTPAQAAAEANADMALVLSVDMNAKFAVSVGTGENPPYKDGSFANQLWSLLDFKFALVAVAVTYYSYGNAPSFRKFVNNFAEWKANREHWIVEHGIATGQTPKNIATGVPFTLPNARAEMEDAGIDRAAWYAMQPIATAAGYNCLQNLDGTLTPTGMEFISP